MNTEQLNNRHPVQGEALPMGTIWKYPLQPQDMTVCEIPKGAKALYVGGDAEGTVCIWFMVDPEQPTEKRAIVVVGTGNSLPIVAAKDYVGTFVVGKYVNHVFVPSFPQG